MKLKDLLQGIPVTSVCADGELEITGVSYDSRTTAPGDVFVAITGTGADGSQFIPQALEKGALCAVCRQKPPVEVPYVAVPSERRALALMAANWFGHPAREMQLVGITGTNGKTTTTFLTRHILTQALDTPVGLIGTVENRIGDTVLPAERTTPESWEVQRLLRQMADAGCTHAVLEVSSHALALDRVYGLHFDAAAVTNLTRDHLDFHDTMERYCAAKGRLLRSCGAAACNSDDPWRTALLQGSTCRRCGFGLCAAADLRAEEITLHRDHVSYTAVTPWERQAVCCPIPGLFSVYNSLTALAVCRELGVSLAQGAAALTTAKGAPGRMEVVPTPGRDYTVLIDYAHTPDALENVLAAVREFTQGRVIALFGCGGDRDRTKRPLMGAAAARLADIAVVTTDNPRTEKPADIIAEILPGMVQAAVPPVVIEDRVEAIGWTLRHAERGDTVVLCGKGHETYQEVRGKKHRLDEREVVAEFLRKFDVI